MNKALNIIIIVLLSGSFAFANKNIRTFKTIEFKDLLYLSKYEIIEKANIYTDGEQIIVDLNSLDKALKKIPFVKSFKIKEKDQNLIIEFKENEPVFSLCVRDEEKNILVELDKEFRILSVNRLHTLNSPLIFIAGQDMGKNGISSRLQSFLRLIYSLQSDNLRIMKEILELDYTDPSNIKGMLKGRRTLFTLKPSREDFNRLNYAVGYFDAVKYYPHALALGDNPGIIK